MHSVGGNIERRYFRPLLDDPADPGEISPRKIGDRGIAERDESGRELPRRSDHIFDEFAVVSHNRVRLAQSR